MTDNFKTTPLIDLLQIILNQLDKGDNLFSLPNKLFFYPSENDIFRETRYGRILESPIGVAAGPHTQLAQNILISWLAGARYIELKTVQTLDEIHVSKPCIDMQDEGYNCEWSQELKLEESFNEYLNALILIHIVKDKLKIGSPDYDGFIFNMSAGYDLKGIKNENVQWFLDKMMNAQSELNAKIDQIKDIYPNVVNLKINPIIADNITLSTMHGCPPDEIEAIAQYLISEKKLHTTIKLNPTLLGKEELNLILKNSGYSTFVPDVAFEHDPLIDDAVRIIKNLSKIAENENRFFGIKLTNTLESINNKDVFPENEKMMYASGKVLHPIAINVARKLQNHFNGILDVSFSGGADAFNIKEIIACGLFPVTVSTDLLKPGGYGRLKQYIDNLKDSSIPENKNMALENLNSYADFVKTYNYYKKQTFANQSIKTNHVLNSFDCAFAPCEETCPTNQGIPSYMYHTAKGNVDKAYQVIAETNPFANVTGMVCDHICQTKCTRINYDSSLLIRDIKRFIVENHNQNSDSENIQDNANVNIHNTKVAVIGAGPSGLSCAYYLRKAGFDVDIYEENAYSGGMVSQAIPKFRLSNTAIDIDINNIIDLGVKIHYSAKVDKNIFENLKKSHNYIYIGVGAQKFRKIFNSDFDISFNPSPIEFFNFANAQQNEKYFTINISKIAVIGGGNTAMDVARTAKRLIGDKGNVSIIYRRTIKEMPADFEEIKGAIDEGVNVMELTHPIEVHQNNGKLKNITFVKMKLGHKDNSGRRSPEIIKNSEFDIDFDIIIEAIGQDIDIDFINKNDIKNLQSKYQTALENVYIGGDALRGASSIINAVGDGRKAAQEIIQKQGIDFNTNKHLARPKNNTTDLMLKKAIRTEGVKPREIDLNSRNNFDLISVTLTKEEAVKEAERCLLCDEVCNICTTLCPNLALQAYETNTVKYNLQKMCEGKIVDDKIFEISQNQQIIHIADWCNQCANCETFCPTAGAPYIEKPHLYIDKSYFEQQKDGYYFDLQNNMLLAKDNENVFYFSEKNEYFEFKSSKFSAILEKQNFRIINYTGKENKSLKKAAQMSIILKGAQNFYKSE